MIITISDTLKEQERKEAELYPELNQGLEVVSENGEIILTRKKETFTAIAKGYVQCFIWSRLKGATAKVLIAIANLTGTQRFTLAGDKCISEYAGVNIKTVREALKELEYYHIIKRNLIPSGSLKRRRRRIVLFRWDTAKPLLIKDKKIIIDDKGEVCLVTPNPFKKCKIPF